MEFIVIGDGGHSKVVQEMINSQKNSKIIAVLDDIYPVAKNKNGVLYGPLAYIQHILIRNVKLVIAVGSNEIRKRIQHQLNIKEHQYGTVIHSTAVISPTAVIGKGTVVMPGVYINAGVTIKQHCIINTGSIVEHDTKIESFSHISPNATLTGNVSIGEGVHIGASATIIPGIYVGNWSSIGAGSTVIKQIPPHCTAVGSPTRIVSGQNKNTMEIRL